MNRNAYVFDISTERCFPFLQVLLTCLDLFEGLQRAMKLQAEIEAQSDSEIESSDDEEDHRHRHRNVDADLEDHEDEINEVHLKLNLIFVEFAGVCVCKL